MPEETKISAKRGMMYIIGFVFNLSYAIPTYINSSFLSKTFADKGIPGGDTLVGIIYAAGSLAAIACFMKMPDILKRLGNLRVTIGLLAIDFVSLTGLIFSKGPLTVVISFITGFVTIALVNYTIDMFLESFSSDSSTGKIRGTFLTASNTAWLVAPLTGSFLLGDDHYANIYIMSALLLVPTIALVYGVLKKFVDPVYSKVPFWKSANEVWTNRNLRGALASQFLLQFFYAWMIIYAPIYLHETMGFNWSSLGIMFSIMLLPFVLIEIPLGRLADKRFGEKEILSLGFVIMAICTWLIPFITDHNFIIWTAILFAGRTGAAMVEIMADTYFFKQVNASNAHLISFSRIMRPLAYIVSPIVASILFIRFDIKILFLALGLLMIFGLRYSLSIVDTK